VPTTVPTIDQIPTPVPSTSDPANFSARADATLGALPGAIDGMNAVVVAMNTLGGELATIENDTQSARDAAQTYASNSAASAALLDGIPGTGGLLANSSVSPTGGASGGGVLVTSALRDVGFTIGIGSGGVNSTINGRIEPTPEDIYDLQGHEVRVYGKYDITNNLLTDKTLAGTTPVNVTRASTGTAAVGSTAVNNPSGTSLIRYSDYTVTSDDLAFGIVATVSASASTATAHSLSLTDTWYVPKPTGTLDERLPIITKRLIRELRRNQLGVTIADTTGNANAAGGATKRIVNGREVGFNITAGQTGGTSFAQVKLTVPPIIRALLNGKRVRTTVWGNVNTDWNRKIVASAQTQQTGGATRTPTLARVTKAPRKVSATRWTAELTFTLQGDEFVIQPFFSNTSGTSAQDDYLEVTEFSMDLLGPAGDISLELLAEKIRLAWAAERPAMHSLFDGAKFTAGLALGATVRKDYRGREIGLTIPALDADANGTVQPIITFEAEEVTAAIGQIWRMRYVMETNAAFARTITINGSIAKTGGSFRTFTALPRIVQVGSVITAEFEVGPFIANDTGPQVYVTVPAGSAAQDDWLEFREIHAEIIQSTDTTRTVQRVNATYAERRAIHQGARNALEVMGGLPGATVTVAASGGNYTTLNAAYTAIFDATIWKPYDVIVTDAVFAEVGRTSKAFTTTKGYGPAHTVIQGFQAASATISAITNVSGFDVRNSAKFEAFDEEVKNCRYGFHIDFSTLVDCKISFKNMRVVHQGNAEAVAYQTSIAGNPGGVWGATHAFGIGLWSGLELTFDGVYASGKNPIYCHSNIDFAKPASLTFNRGWLIGNGPLVDAVAFNYQPLGAGVVNIITITNSVLRGGLYFGGAGWSSDVTATRYLADHATSDVLITGSGNTAVPYVYVDCVARALRLESNSTGGTSAIVVTPNTAGPVLFGDTIYTDASGGGLPGAVYGKQDVADHTGATPATVGTTSPVNPKLAYWLGNRTGASITMDVAVDGGSAQTITLNADYSAMTNAQILTALNALVTGATFSLMDVSERMRPQFGNEVTVYNSSATAIRRKRAVARNTDGDARPMTDSDAASLFLGIALENIPPGKQGRVKVAGGVVRTSVDFDRSDGVTAFAAGDTFEVSNSSGQLAKGTTRPIATATTNADVRLGA
jgi:hypothetical protein